MSFTLVLRIFDENPIQRGDFYCSQNFLQEIKENFPIITSLTAEQIESVVLIYAKPIDFHKPAKKVKMNSFTINDSFLRIDFTVSEEIEFTSDEIRKRLFTRLNSEHILKNIKFLPVCCVLNEEQTAFIFQKKSSVQRRMIEDIEILKQNNDWKGIYNKVKPIEELPNKKDIWNDQEILNNIGFATGKLAETTEIPKTIFQNEIQKKEFLEKQSKYRYETELIRKRCIELNPQNSSYHSTLGYLFYQNSIELSAPKGRRDGNILEEIDKAVECFDKALSFDEKRITDLYRKGRLLAEVKPNIILFGRQKRVIDFQERNQSANESKQAGIKSLLLSVKYWEELDSNNKKENDNKNRTRSSYVKALYNLGNAFYELINNDWDESVFLLALRDGINNKDSISFIPQDLENINKSIESFQKCSLADFKQAEPKENILDIANEDGFIEGVNKLYSIGKAFFTKYWILGGYGQKDTEENISVRNLAKEFFIASLNCPWAKEKIKQNKHFIAERLARLYITSGEYSEAISIIKKHCGEDVNRISAFVLNTLSLAHTLNGEYPKAHLVLKKATESKSNIAVWQTHFITGCAYLREGKLTEAKKYFNIADGEARKIGKQTVDSFLIAHAFVEYKSENKPKAIEFLKSAYELNQYRIFVSKKLQQWQK